MVCTASLQGSAAKFGQQLLECIPDYSTGNRPRAQRAGSFSCKEAFKDSGFSEPGIQQGCHALDAVIAGQRSLPAM